MPFWQFEYSCMKGRGPGRCEYMGEVTFKAEDLAGAMRSFKLWARSRPSDQDSIKAKAIQPLTELSEEKNGETMKISAPTGSFVLPREGEHEATLIDIQDLGMQPNTFKPGEEQRKFRLIWKIKGGSEQWQTVNASAHHNSTLSAIYNILVGHPPPGNGDIETDDMKNKKAYILIRHGKSEKTGKTFANVKDVRPVAYAGRQMPPPMELEEEQGDVPF